MEALFAVIAGAAVGAVLTFAIMRPRVDRAPLDLQAELVRNDIAQVRDSVTQLNDLVQRTGGDGKASFAALSTVLRNVDDRTNALAGALANSRVRGQWGERAAEDILRAAGFVENISYFTQRSQNGTRPDFSFPLPQGYRVNMDVKFPIENYIRALEADATADREGYEKAFIRDVRERIKEVRKYADPTNGTVDYALLFIPSEGVYSEINRLAPSLIDDALAQRVIPCSPLTLFGVLAVIRKAVESFALHQASDDVLRLMATFDKEWVKFSDTLTVLGRQLATVRGTYDELDGRRQRALQAPLDDIDALRNERGLASADLPRANDPIDIQSNTNELDSGAGYIDGTIGQIESAITGHDAPARHRA
jgi:DNA recombination protein RmuC